MKKVCRTLRLAEYGGDELILSTLCCSALAWSLHVLAPTGTALIALLPWVTVLYFFRDPDRSSPGDPLAWLSPADGRVQDIETVEEPDFMGGPALRIGIFLSPLNVHVNRAPFEGMVQYLKYRAGEFLPAYNPKAPTQNESMSMGLVTEQGGRFLVKQITGVVARRIICDARIGQRLEPGERYGMIKFGSRTELYVPASSGLEPLVKVGDHVRGGRTILLRGEIPTQTEGEDRLPQQAGVLEA